jgi:hypothetical protein
MAELKALQAERISKEKEDLKEATGRYVAARHVKIPFDFDSFGFEFSKERFIKHLATQRPPIPWEEFSETMQATV